MKNLAPNNMAIHNACSVCLKQHLYKAYLDAHTVFLLVRNEHVYSVLFFVYIPYLQYVSCEAPYTMIYLKCVKNKISNLRKKRERFNRMLFLLIL